jgi:hypothetical protein
MGDKIVRAVSFKIACVAAGVVGATGTWVDPSHAAESALAVVTDLPAYQSAAGGPVVVEDFTETDHAPLLGCRLDSSTREAGLQPGDVEEGVVFSTLCSDPEDFELNIDSGSFQGGFLDGFHHGERSAQRALRVSFTEPVRAFGFDTNAHMGHSFTVRVVHTDGQVDVLDGLAVTAGYVDEQFYGFVSDTADITRVRVVGRGDHTFGFALDDFRFNPAA